ncbi:uncharacterized protein LOC119835546 [Zerene cesonia]|uniref:uncharacterized protein LOC119835546 n=1 Tax=Zerene cesonia TaxID=33412 RepID=UPI0018E5897B|nr:uncharacterized protein LOC119835546 [Zerene cesonia]
MWRCGVVLFTLLVVTSTIDVRLLRRYHGSSAKVDCFDLPEPRDLKFFKHLDGAVWRSKKSRNLHPIKYRATPSTRLPSRRIDLVFSNKEDIVKEHAKLVQDINSLRQVLYVPPLADDLKDYEDSIFHEILETSTTPRPGPTPTKRAKTGIPILLVGGASNKVKGQPVKVTKQTYSLVGTSVSPVVKHPYPFVTTPTRSPIRVCMATPVSYASKRPTLWERIVNTIIPR